MGKLTTTRKESSSAVWEYLEELVRMKVREFIQTLLEDEVTELLRRGKSARRDALDSPLVYRNGDGKGRKLTLGCGTIAVRRLCFTGHVLMENRNGMVVDIAKTQATGTAERNAALDMLERVPVLRRITVGADTGYDSADFVTMCRRMDVTPHVACCQWSKVDGRTTRHAGYQASQRIRKRVEEIFGWVKTVGGGRKLRYRGIARNRLW